MNRRKFMALGGISAVSLLAAAESGISEEAQGAARGNSTIVPLRKSADEWRKLLAPAAFRVLFQEGTERPFSSEFNSEKRDGTYLCAACRLPLFDAGTKFESGTGWPSFYRPIEGHLGTKQDWRTAFLRTEYHCARCGGHQGHVFDDGPRPTGQRWCNNGVALHFVPAGEVLPALRT